MKAASCLLLMFGLSSLISAQVPANGLIAYYPFNGNSLDESGNGNHGVVYGALTVSDQFGVEDSAYIFDGIDDKIVVEAPNGGWPSGSSDRTVSLWIFKEVYATSTGDNLFTFGDGNTYNARFSLLLDKQYGFSFVGEGGNGYNMTGDPRLGVWEHVAIVYDQGEHIVYLNGSQFAQFTITALNTNGNMPFIIGSNSLNRNDEFFKGLIDEVRIYNRALSGQEIAQLYATESIDNDNGLVAYYPFNGNANDHSGNGYNGTVIGADLANNRFNIPESAYYFDGINFDQIQVPLPLMYSISMNCWIKAGDGNTGGGVGRFIHSEPEWFDIGIASRDGRTIDYKVGSSNSWMDSSIEVTLDTWEMVTITAGGNVFKIYKNGLLQASYPYNGTLGMSPQRIGSYIGNPGDDFNGLIDDVRFYNKVLSEEDISALFESETAGNFVIVEGSYTWEEAKTDAELRGGRLAVLSTQYDIDSAYSYLWGLGTWPVLHIGLSDTDVEGQWKWVDGSTLNQSLEILTASNGVWGAPNEPNGGISENYVVIRGSNDDQREGYGGFADVTSSNAYSYLLDVSNQPEPLPPSLPEIPALLEPKVGDSVNLDATAISGYPAPTYQWYYEGFPLSEIVGGTQPVLSIPATVNPVIEGTYRCVATNSEGSDEVETLVVLFRDDDEDTLSNYREENIYLTDPNDDDSDDDGLKDNYEVKSFQTDPNDPDSDDDTFSDYDEVIIHRTDPTVFNPIWGLYIVHADNWVDTSDWLGWLNLKDGGWVWSVNEDDYLWIPDSSAAAGSGWIYAP